MHVKGLALAQELAPDRLADRSGSLLADVGEDGAAVGRWSVDHGEVPDAGQGHLQRPRNGARRQGQHVDALGHAFHGLLVGHAEALFLVDDEQTEVLELHVLGQQPVRADDHVDAPVGQALRRRRAAGPATRKRLSSSTRTG